MYYEIHGTGKPLVVLHGAFGWATAYPTLAKDRQLIAIELQGHGHTADVSSALRSGHFRGVARASPPKVDRGVARARARFGHGVRQREAGHASRVMW